jgi:ankyrin repeat protein
MVKRTNMKLRSSGHNTPLENGLIFGNISLIDAENLVAANPEALRPPRGEESIVSRRLPIHCACSVYLRFDIIAMLLEKYPEGAKVVWQGRLPIHLACTNRVNLDVLNLLIELYPESLDVVELCGVATPSQILRNNHFYDNRVVRVRLLQDAIIGGYSANVCQVIVSAFPESTLIKDENGILPLHLCIRHFTNFENRGNRLEVFLLLLNSAPQFVCDDAEAKTTAKMLMSTCNEDTGLLLLHQSAANRHFSLTVLEFLNAAYPSSVSKVDGCGMLPFHYACLNPDATVDALMMLLLLYPESIAANNIGYKS